MGPENISNPAMLVEGAPETCCRCGAPLCLRKQVINLALGDDQQMQCLACLAVESNTDVLSVLKNTLMYVDSRQCFKKEWTKYADRSHCPDPDGCVPDACFAENPTN